MGAAYPIVELNTPIQKVSDLLAANHKAVLVELENKKYQIITKYDIINSL